jgi:hypothetical protein
MFLGKHRLVNLGFAGKAEKLPLRIRSPRQDAGTLSRPPLAEAAPDRRNTDRYSEVAYTSGIVSASDPTTDRLALLNSMPTR